MGSNLSISREAKELAYGDYITRYWLLTPGEDTPERATAFTVPSFQRGISWGFETIEKFIESDSRFLGSVILGRVNGGERQLIDGLQRFVIGTGLLNRLYRLVLCPEPEQPDKATHFRDLSDELRTKQPVFAHNNQALTVFPRNAIRLKYSEVNIEIGRYVTSQLEEDVEEFARKLTSLFLDKQMAVDSWSGWTSYRQILQAFIGLNTVRVDLSVVDLIRASIVEQAAICGWNEDDIEDIENDFTDTFTARGIGNAKRALIPLASLINDAFDEDNYRIFPEWSDLKPVHVRRFLTFVNESIAAAERGTNTFLFAIAQVGALPLAICILFYYFRSLSAGAPPVGSDFDEAIIPASNNELVSPNSTTLKELHEFYRACTRRSLNGDIGKIGNVGRELMKAHFAGNLSHFAANVSPDAAGPLDQPINETWLKGRLWSAGKEGSKVIFQAYQLPMREDFGGAFTPIKYGRASADYQIDHIIPTEALEDDTPERERGDSLVNFCPITGLDNRSFRELSAADKLGHRYASAQSSWHPYMHWLQANSAYSVNELNSVLWLGEAREMSPGKPSIGELRITHLTSELRDRL